MSISGVGLSNALDFSFLDNEEFKAKYVFDSSKICFYIAGIRCEKCVRKLEGLVGEVNGLRSLRVEMGKNLAHVEIETGKVTFADVARKIEQAGFQPLPLSNEQSFQTLQRLEDRRDLIRLGVAGACAGNIMTYAFATYFGGMVTLFSWLSFALYLPVVSYVAWPFYKGAWQSLRQGRLSIDLPMAVASLAGFIFSTTELLRGHSDVYYDSLSGFLFLILVARWTQKRLQRKFLSPTELIQGIGFERVRVGNNEGWRWRPLEKLTKGDSLRLEENETLPADAELLTTKAYFSLAWLSGEAKAKTFLQGSLVPAGARLLSPSATLIARRPLKDTGFGRILEQAQKFSLSGNKAIIASDRWAQWLLILAFGTALSFLVLYWPVNPEQAIQRAIALIIVVCPCAMAFGTPLALAVSLKKARKAGLILRDANVFSSARAIQTICFDKTGTLTDMDISLLENTTEISSEHKKIILSLEKDSLHSIAFAFRKAFGTQGELFSVENATEIAGSGVTGKINGVQYSLRKCASSTESMSCELLQEDKPVARFHFSSFCKAGSQSTLESLRQRGFQLRLLSGDKSLAALSFGKTLGFKPEEIFAGLTPEQKAEEVARLPHVMMVGDGINDSLALMRSEVGVAVSGGVEAALKSASVYLIDPGIQGVIALIDASETSASLVRQNLTISAVYNVSAGSLALLGHINPFVAAILMPISSGFLLLNTWWRSR